ncbi:DNA topoisomerase domain protein [Mycobacterium xenopi 4042]|uniref:DNA topoisomerase domain protein n=1 Tax=Mycobacterium xenopi 4042 TaxID=1299334 RepID=X7ZVF8_MYCXE|nr:DNA topoisomerase domain protein [Mycobacterium xenopi 4042]
MVDVHAEACPRFGFVLGGHVCGVSWQVADVPREDSTM